MSDQTTTSGAQSHEPPPETSEQTFGFQLNGYGTCTFADGSKYVGEFKDGLFDGQGSHQYADGSTYVGGFCEGHFSGHGTLTSASGTKVEGEFAQGIFVGAFDVRPIAQISDSGLTATATKNGAPRLFLRVAWARNVLVPLLFLVIGLWAGRWL